MAEYGKHFVESGPLRRVLVVGAELAAGENFGARVALRQEQDLLVLGEHHHRARLAPAGEIQKIGFLKEADVQIVGLVRAEQHHHAVERLAQLGSPRAILVARDSIREQRRHRQHQPE